MPSLEPERLLTLLRDPNVDSQEVAAAAGVPREDAARAARLLVTIAKASPEEFPTLPGPLAAALARAAIAAGRGDVLAALATHAGKDVVKEAKRGLHVLKSRGIAVPEPTRPAAAVPATAPEPPLSAFGTAIDGNGDRAIWLPRAVPGRGVEVAQAVVSDERGLVELQVGVLGRKEWRAFMKEILGRGAGMGVGELDPGRAHALVAAARAHNEVTGQRVPEGADLWLAQLGPAAPSPDPAARFARLPDEEERDAVAQGAKLHDLPLLRSWLPDEAFLKDVARRLDEVMVSPLYLDEVQRGEQAARVVAEATDGYLDAPRRRVLSSRLFAIAEHLEDRGDPAHARLAAASARALGAGLPAREVPFARLLVEKVFPAPPLAGPEPEPEGGGSLIVAPR